MGDDVDCWKIGDLAAATGLTVRTLHHFDRIGLLAPKQRSPAGHRVYTAPDVQRLYRILALRQLGMPLAEIATTLAGDVSNLESAVAAQLAHVKRHIDTQHRLRIRLVALLRAIRESDVPTTVQLIDAMEATVASFLTPEQREKAKQRHREPGFRDRMAQWHALGGVIGSALESHMDNGTDPADPAVVELASRWTGLMLDMVGGDRVMLSALYARMDSKGPAAATRGALSASGWEYLKRVFAAGFAAP